MEIWKLTIVDEDRGEEDYIYQYIQTERYEMIKVLKECGFKETRAYWEKKDEDRLLVASPVEVDSIVDFIKEHKEKCVWVYDEILSAWQTDCDHKVSNLQSGYKVCPFCAKEFAEATEEDEENAEGNPSKYH